MEFALIVLLLMTMMLGIIDFCRAAYAYHFVSNAAREATRYAAVRGFTCNTDSSCSQATPRHRSCDSDRHSRSDYVTGIHASSAGFDQGHNDAELASAGKWPGQLQDSDENDPGCTVQVTVSYSFSFIFPLVYKPFSSTGTITLSSNSEMIIVH